jgi:hypothetical protein
MAVVDACALASYPTGGTANSIAVAQLRTSLKGKRRGDRPGKDERRPK